MLFKLNYTIRDLIIPKDEPLVFDFEGQRKIEVIVRSPNQEEQSQGHKSTNAFCIASSTFKASKKNLAIFEQIKKNEVWNSDSDFGWGTRYKDASGLEITLPHLSGFPDHFQSFIRQTHGELSEAAKCIVSVLRWRCNQTGRHNPISTRGMQWSYDGSFWHPAPFESHARVLADFSNLRINDATQRQVLSLAASIGSEPIYHELFREAWFQRTVNPRSSLITGMSSAEISLKQCIGQLIPDAQWLADNVPSPPLIKMINEYLPKLPVKNNIKGKVIPPSKRVIDTLKKGVTIRNQIAHAGQKPPGDDAVEEILLAVRDLLWLIDYYCGHEWALKYIRAETRLDMGIDWL